jgi:hypothetical protein
MNLRTPRSSRPEQAALWLLLACAVQGATLVTVTVDPSVDRHPISPYIYGANHDIAGFDGWTAMRLCGNRMSTYNWLNNASNAGHDGIPPNTNDDWWLVEGLKAYWPTVRVDGPREPACVITRFHDAAVAREAYSLVGLQSAGYVAADTNHVVGADEAAPSPRWMQVVAHPDAGLSRRPVACMEELVRLLVKRYGAADGGRGIRGYSLDNEPGLWHETHPLMHPAPATCREVIDKSVALAKVVKDVDQRAETFGPGPWGMTAMDRLSDESDWKETNTDERYGWFLDYYLHEMAQASEATDVRLLDVLDLHWYADADNVRNGGGTAVINAPRSLWDASYREPTWIGRWFNRNLPLLAKAHESIKAHYPGTKLALSEYNWSMADRIEGGLAQAEALGVFGRMGVYLACYYQPVWQADDRYAAAAFQLFRNYDGKGGCFGDVSIAANASDGNTVGAYAAVSTSGNRLHLVLTNRSYVEDVTVKTQIAAADEYVHRESWMFGPEEAILRRIDAVAASPAPNAFTCDLPPLSAVHVVLRRP